LGGDQAIAVAGEVDDPAVGRLAAGEEAQLEREQAQRVGAGEDAAL
jgi:hypothetical protein